MQQQIPIFVANDNGRYMIELTLTINKRLVYEEVAKTTSYTGNKQSGDDEKAYDRIATTDADKLMLERFWNECCNESTDQLKQFVVSVSSQPVSNGLNMDSNYEVKLELSGSYDTSLNDSVQTALFSFFVSGIISKWYRFANKKETEEYAVEADKQMASVIQKVYYRKKPTRKIPT